MMPVESREEYAGHVVITWPKSLPGVPLLGLETVIADADTGKSIVSALDLTLTADPKHVVVAEMTMLTDEHGNLLELNGPPAQIPLDDSGEVYTRRFRWLVTEMRIAD